MIILLTIVLFSLLLVFLIFILLIYSALNKTFRYRDHANKNIKFSVIIAAKNESNNIAQLIDAMKNQDYPEEFFEVIIVDDTSSDDTFAMATLAVKDLANFKVIEASEKSYPAKRGALDLGIKASVNPYIMITDADCIPSKNWISSFNDLFESGYDFVFGIAPYWETKSFTNKIARFENLRSQMIMIAFTKLGFPYSAASRSFGFSRLAFQNIGGYKNTMETLSGDDDLLLREAINNKYKIGICTNPDAFVYSDTKDKYSEYLSQKLRHTSTSYYYSFKNKIVLSLWHFSNIILLFSLFLMLNNSIFFLPIFLKIILDLFMLNSFQRNFGYKFNIFEMIVLQILYEFQLIYFFLLAWRYSSKWK